MQNPQPIGTCAILINAQNQVLLGKRKNSYKAGQYGLPGGRVELSESIHAAIAREVTEETGLENLDFSFVGVVRENQGEYDFIHFVFLAKISDQQPMLCEPKKCEGWEWFDLDGDLSEVLAGHKAGIEMYKKDEYIADLVH